MISATGELDRERMRNRVFRDPGARRKLEAILHPRIARLRRHWEEEQRHAGAEVVACEVPLLFEAGLEDAFDQVVVVDAPAELRERRLVLGRGIGAGEARRIMESQGDPETKRERADHVLENRGSLDDLRSAALTLLERIRKEGVR